MAGLAPSPTPTPPAAEQHSMSSSPYGAATLAGGSESGAAADKGREQVGWPRDVWEAIDRHVHDEMMRTHVAQKFLPHAKVHHKTTSVPTDSVEFINLPNETTPTLQIDEGATIRVLEIWTEFALSHPQVTEVAESHEAAHSTAVTLAIKAANLLAIAQDSIVFQGVNALALPFFQEYVHYRTGQYPTDTGLLSYPALPSTPLIQNGQLQSNAPLPASQVIQVEPMSQEPSPYGYGEGPGVIYGTNTFAAATSAISLLQNAGHYGPYVVVLQTTPFADAYAPVLGLVITADRLKGVADAGFYGTGTLVSNAPALGSPPASPPVEPAYTGLVLSLGGNTFDVVIGHHATAHFMQIDPNGWYRFQIKTRFVSRIKDPTAIIRLEFQ
jgi:uncharacterized linocin/CFP29 family protein